MSHVPVGCRLTAGLGRYQVGFNPVEKLVMFNLDVKLLRS